MSVRASRRARQPVKRSKHHPHSNQPSREQLQRENERLLREIEELRRKVSERDKQLADAEKQIADAEREIADLERQLALRRQNSTNSSKPPSSDGLAGNQRPRGRTPQPTQAGGPAGTRRASPPAGSHRRGERVAGAAAESVSALREKAAARSAPSDRAGRAAPASGHRNTVHPASHHRISIPEPGVWSVRKG